MATCVFIIPLLWLSAGIGGRAEYIGGTLSTFTQKTEGRILASAEDRLVFQTKRATIEVPYREINLLEYGQKTDRRYMAAMLVSPIFLLSKKREHFLTLGYSDPEGRQQAMVFRIGKGDVRPVLASLEARTGVKVQYQDNEARKAAWGSR